MTRARRPLAAAAALALAALVVLAPAAAGQGEAGQADCDQLPNWGCIDWGTAPGAAFTGTELVTGTLAPNDPSVTLTDITITLTRVAEAGQGGPACPSPVAFDQHLSNPNDDPPPTSTTTTPETGTPFAVPVSPVCNGRYHVRISVFGQRPGQEACDPPADLACTTDELGDPDDPGDAIRVALPPPDVAASSATAADRTVTLNWQSPSGYGAAAAAPPDFLGFVIQRSLDGGSTYRHLALVGTSGNSYTDALGPAEPGGTYAYRVLAYRTGAVAGEFAVAPGGATAIASVEIAAPPTTATTPTTAGGPAGPGRPNAGVPAVAGTIPTTTIDEGFSELDYDEEPGEEAAVPPEDSFLDFVPSPGAGVLAPFAVAECLAVWALHLRYLARRADGGY